jgi:uncharacterized protein (TIRG00374 family)
VQVLLATTKYKVTWRTFVLLAVGILAFLVYLFIFRIDIPSVIETFKKIDLRIYFLAFLAMMFDVLFFAISWRFLLNFLSVKLSLVRSLLYVWYGIFMDIVIPAESISGEISRYYLVTREQNEASGKVVASLITHRLMGMGINAASLLTGITVLLALREVGGIVMNLTILLLLGTISGLLVLFLFCIQKTWPLKIVDASIRLGRYISRGKWKLDKVRDDAHNAIRMFHDSMKEFKRAPKTLAVSFSFYVMSWLFNVSVSYLVFLSIGFPLHWSVIVVTSSIVIAVKSIPIGIPFEVGLPEVAMTALYSWFGVPFDISTTATILNRLLTLWLRFFIGFGVQQLLEIKTVATPTAPNMTSTTQTQQN